MESEREAALYELQMKSSTGGASSGPCVQEEVQCPTHPRKKPAATTQEMGTKCETTGASAWRQRPSSERTQSSYNTQFRLRKEEALDPGNNWKWTAGNEPVYSMGAVSICLR